MPADRRRPRVLLVDDDCDLLRLLVLRVQSAGWEARACESAEAALTELGIMRPDVVVTDLRMGSMDGMALFEAIKSRHPALPVIILTAHGSIPEAITATRSGVFGFLTKPFDGKELLAELERALRIGGDEADEPEGWPGAFATRSPRMMELLAQARLIARSDLAVLITGPSGSGKEVLARALHGASRRRGRKFVAINCAAIPETLLESELFGHVRGAFTGATREYAGLFAEAEGGTLLLDEVGDMPLGLQVKLLRVLQDRTIRPVGSTASRPVDARIVSATHRNLEERIAAGMFREDLYYRLNVARLELPCLAERREDIPLLAQRHFAKLAADEPGPARRLSPEALELMAQVDWPGNVRQLHNVIEHAYVLCTTPLIPASLVRQALRAPAEALPPLVDARERFERDYLVQLLKLTEGSVARAARLAKRNRTDLYKLLDRHGLNPAAFKSPRPGLSPATDNPSPDASST